MSVDSDWCLPTRVDQSRDPDAVRTLDSPQPPDGIDSAEVRAIVGGGIQKLKEWLDERLNHQERLLYHLINARAPLSTNKKRQLQKRKQAFAVKVDDLSGSVFESILPPGQPPALGGPAAGAVPAPANPQQKLTGNEEDSSKTSSHQSPTDSDDVEDLAEYKSAGLPGVVDSEAESPFDSPREAAPAPAPIETRLEVASDKESPGRSPSQTASIDITAGTGLNLHEWRKRMLDLFDDLDLDGSGSIDRSELRQAFIEVGIPPIAALETFLIADQSNSSDIDRVEWLHIIEAASTGKDAGPFIEFAKKLIDAKESGEYRLTANRGKGRFIIRHDSIPRMTWDMFMVLLLAYVSVSLPFSFGFGSVDTIEAMDTVCDAFFLFDIVLNFRTSYIDSDECLVLSGMRIAKHYLKTWFALDLVSSMPWDSVSAGLLPNLQAARVLKIGKIAKVLKLLRIGKVIKSLAGSTLLERIEENLPPKAHQTGSKLLYLVLVTMMLCHWLACFMAASDGGSIDKYLGPDEPKDRRYLAALYWAMTTLTTTGYGDIIATSDKERMYSMFAMVVGGAFYGYIIGSMTSVITDMDIDARVFNEKMEMLDAWLEWHDVIPTLLKRRIRRHFRRQLRERTSIDDHMIIKNLSPELRADAASFVIHVEVRRNIVFRDLPNSALGSLVEVLNISSSKKGENIVSVGDPGIAMYIIVAGSARFSAGHLWIPSTKSSQDSPSNANARLKQMTKLIEGDSFGEEIIFTMEETYKYSIVANTLVSMYSLSEDAFKSRFRNMPDLYDTMLSNFLKSRK